MSVRKAVLTFLERPGLDELVGEEDIVLGGPYYAAVALDDGRVVDAAWYPFLSMCCGRPSVDAVIAYREGGETEYVLLEDIGDVEVVTKTVDPDDVREALRKELLYPA